MARKPRILLSIFDDIIVNKVIYIQVDSLSIKHSLPQKVFMFLKILFYMVTSC